jgi:hypothetical protein
MGHVNFVRDNFARLTFQGKKDKTNVAEISDRAILSVLSEYINRAAAKGSKYLWTTEKGAVYGYADLDKYFKNKLLSTFEPTDFRKLKATETVLDGLRNRQEDLYKRIQAFADDKAEDAKEKVVEAIQEVVEAAYEEARSALSHHDEGLKTTIDQYINPMVLLRFLSQGSIENSLQDAILNNKTLLRFDPSVFIEKATGNKVASQFRFQARRVRGSGGWTLKRLLENLEDPEDETIKLGAAAPWKRPEERPGPPPWSLSDARAITGLLKIGWTADQILGAPDWRKYGITINDINDMIVMEKSGVLNQRKEARMSHLRDKLIRVAYENPGNVRKAILPLLKTAVTYDDAKIKEFLMSARKKSYGKIESMGKIKAMLDYVGGWSVEPFIGLVPQHSTYGGDVRKTMLWGAMYSNLDEIQDQLKKLQVKRLPANPKMDQPYVMGLERTENSVGRSSVSFLCWIGAWGFKFTSPGGAIYELLPEGGFDMNKNLPWEQKALGKRTTKYLRPGRALTWMYRETEFMEQVLQALDMGSMDSERAQKVRTRDNTGTCAICFRNIKLKKSGKDYRMVDHGYKIPGRGWGRSGNCFGVGYSPYEVSARGTQAYIKELQAVTKRTKAQLKGLQTGKLDSFNTWDAKSGRQIKIESTNKRWTRLLASFLRQQEGLLKDIASDIKTYTALVSNWKLAPLPKEGDQFKDLMNRRASGKWQRFPGGSLMLQTNGGPIVAVYPAELHTSSQKRKPSFDKWMVEVKSGPDDAWQDWEDPYQMYQQDTGADTEKAVFLLQMMDPKKGTALDALFSDPRKAQKAGEKFAQTGRAPRGAKQHSNTWAGLYVPSMRKWWGKPAKR